MLWNLASVLQSSATKIRQKYPKNMLTIFIETFPLCFLDMELRNTNLLVSKSIKSLYIDYHASANKLLVTQICGFLERFYLLLMWTNSNQYC